MNKLTKVEALNNAEILAWVRNQPFARTRKDKLCVPDLTPQYVLEHYRPPFTEMGQFFTPLWIADELMSLLPGLRWDHRPDVSWHVLDPAAGIGHLLQAIAPVHTVKAVEIEYEAFSIGQKLFPAVNWVHGNGLYPRGTFDVLIANPPFGSYGALNPEPEIYVSGRNGTHLFLKLATKVLRPGGVALYVLPYGGRAGGVDPFAFEQLPKKLAALLTQEMRLDIVRVLESASFSGTKIVTQLVKLTKRPYWT